MVGNHGLREEGARPAWLRHWRKDYARQRNSHYSHHHRRWPTHHGFFTRAIQRWRVGHRDNIPNSSRRTGTHTNDHDSHPYEGGAGAGISGAEETRRTNGASWLILPSLHA